MTDLEPPEIGKGGMGQKGARVELPIQLCRAVTPPTVRFAPPTLCYVPPSVVRFDRFLASKRTLSTAGSQRCFEVEDFVVLKFLFARFAKDSHQLTWHFAPPTFSEKTPPMHWVIENCGCSYTGPGCMGTESLRSLKWINSFHEENKRLCFGSCKSGK